MNTLSFISANFVARQTGYNMTGSWMHGDSTTQDFYRPLETFEPRFAAMLDEVKGMGFSAIDVWGAQLNPDWASAEHLQTARRLLDARGLKVTSIATGVHSLEALEGLCRVAVAVGAPLIGGGAIKLMQESRAETLAILKAHGVKLGLENHPEKTPQEMIEQIGDSGDGYLGTALDTGWWATQSYDAAQAIHALKDHLLSVHFKDIRAAGTHVTCRFGEGIVDLPACVRALREVGYTGVIGVEHEPEFHDPTQDVIASRQLLEGWLTQYPAGGQA